MFKKIKGRFAETKAKQERSVISYEDMPLEDYEQEKTEISAKTVKRIIFAVVGVMLLALIVFAFANREKLTWDNINVWWNYELMGAPGKGYPVNIIGSEAQSGNFSVHQGRVAYASDTSFVTLNSTGTEISNDQLRYTKPMMKSAENRYLVYGLGENTYQLQAFDRKLYEGECEAPIVAGDICPTGEYCLVVEGNGFFSELYAFDKNHNRLFKYSFSEYYINTVMMNMDGTGCIACGISNSNGEIKSGVYVLDFKQELPLAKYEVEADYIIEGKYISNSHAVLVGGNASYLVKVDEAMVDVVEYEEKTLAGYCFCPSAGSFSLALSKSGDGRRCNIITYNDSAERLCEISTDLGCESLSSYRGMVAALDNNTLYVYDREGALTAECNAGAGAKRVILNSENEAFVLSVNQIRKIDIHRESTPDSAKK